MKSEYDIHDIIRYYPYILGEEFESLDLKHEKIYEDRTRADFVFSSNQKSIVVEVKKGYIDEEMLNQATYYLNNESKENPGKTLKGVLVGRRKPGSLGFVSNFEHSGYTFEAKLLDIDLPMKIRLCDKCRKVNDKSSTVCKYCGSKKFVIDPFLFSMKYQRRNMSNR